MTSSQAGEGVNRSTADRATYADLTEANEAVRESVANDRANSAEVGMAARHAIRRLIESLERHREEDEAPGGNLESLVAEKPNLEPEVERQKDIYRDLLERCESIESLIDETLAMDSLDVDMLRLELNVVTALVELLVARATDLFYEAWFQVEGGRG